MIPARHVLAKELREESNGRTFARVKTELRRPCVMHLSEHSVHNFGRKKCNLCFVRKVRHHEQLLECAQRQA